MKTLESMLAHEQQNVRDLLPWYDSIPSGAAAATMLRQSLERAELAIESGDADAMRAAYDDLRRFDA